MSLFTSYITYSLTFNDDLVTACNLDIGCRSAL